MRLSLDGIGAVLQSREDYTVIREVVPGGPADKSGKIKVGDRIVGVAQGKAPFTDVMGWRIDDVVQLVRGERKTPPCASTCCRPTPARTASTMTISLVRQKISMEEQSAKKQIIEVKDGGVKRRIGVISLPTFYQDFEARRKGDKDFKSATRDVAAPAGRAEEGEGRQRADRPAQQRRRLADRGGRTDRPVHRQGPGGAAAHRRGRVEVESDTNPAWPGTVRWAC
jgi:carboxyl-terminal processing protease